MTRPFPRVMSDETIAAIREARNTPCPCCNRLPAVKDVAAQFNTTVGTVARIANGNYCR